MAIPDNNPMYRHINVSSIYQYFGEDDTDMIKEMIHIILTTNLKDLKSLPTLFSNGDLLILTKLCHKAKPTMSYIGAHHSKKLLEKIERSPTTSDTIITELAVQINEIEDELKHFLANLE